MIGNLFRRPGLVPLWLALAAALAAIAIVAILGLQTRRDALLMLDLQSNHVLFNVSRPGTAMVVVRQGWLRQPVECDGPGGGQAMRLQAGPLTGLLAPAHGTVVEYIWQPRSLSLRYTPTPEQAGPFVSVLRAGEANCDLSQRSLVVTLPHAALAAMAPLPIVGEGSIGRITLERGPPTAREPVYLPGTRIEDLPTPGNFLHGGVIRIYARARAGEAVPRIFPIPDAEFEVPRNSRVDFGLADNNGHDPGNVAMQGWASLDPQGRGLSIHAVTTASDVRITGIGGVTAISAGALAVAVNDPSNARLFTGLAIFIFLFPTLISVWQLVRDGRRAG